MHRSALFAYARARVTRAACVACAAIAAASLAQAQLAFQERAAQWGIVHAWQGQIGEAGGGNFGGGAAIEDYDQDGDQDVFLAGAAGWPLAVFRNDGAAGFTELGAQLGLGDLGTSKQLLVLDLDGDGHRDLLATSWAAQTRLFRGTGEGFVDASASSGLSRTLDDDFPGLATGACAGDIDRDGDLDLHVSYWKAGPPSPASQNVLYRNDGGLHFSDITVEAGVIDQGKSFQSVLVDLDGDGWLDLVVAEDKPGGMTCFHNDGDGSFTDRTVESGIVGRVTTSGRLATAMGIAVGDYDNDGDPDLYSTNIEDGNLLYRNDSSPGALSFLETAAPAGVLSQRFAWGTAFFDCDNDGWLDLFVANTGSGRGSSSEDRLYLNLRDGTFVDIAPQVGLADDGNAYAVACGDLDLDGDVDFIETHDVAPTLVYANATAGAHWLKLRLRGVASNREAVGAHVQVVAGGMPQTRQVVAGTSYLSHDSLELEFGLGASTSVERVDVRWPTGYLESFGALQRVDRSYLLVEGTATPTTTRLVGFSARVADPSGRGGETAAIDLEWQVLGDGLLALWRCLGGDCIELAPGIAPSGRWRDHVSRGVSEKPAVMVGYRLLDLHTGVWLGQTAVSVTSFAGTWAHPRLTPPRPNPANPRVVIEVLVPPGAQGRPATLRILDARGRRIARLFDGQLPDDRLVANWDGCGDDARPAPSGSYRVVLETEGRRDVVPLLLLR